MRLATFIIDKGICLHDFFYSNVMIQNLSVIMLNRKQNLKVPIPSWYGLYAY